MELEIGVQSLEPRCRKKHFLLGSIKEDFVGNTTNQISFFFSFVLVVVDGEGIYEQTRSVHW